MLYSEVACGSRKKVFHSGEVLAAAARLDSVLAAVTRHSILGMLVTAARLDSVLAAVARHSILGMLATAARLDSVLAAVTQR